MSNLIQRVLPVGLLTLVISGAATAAGNYKAPRLDDGTPDLQGVWTNTHATPFERSEQFGNRRSFTKAEADAIEARERGRVEADAKPSDPNAKQEAGALPPVGNYNLFWTDRGMTAALINGEYRTSVIIDPPNGRVPPMTQKAMERRTGARGARQNRPAGPAADGPEQRGLGERCLLSFGNSSGPPMLPTMYNSYYQIVQSPGHVVILVEMVHDARIVRLGGKHDTSGIKKWMGDSVGHWEGDTLIVKTKNFRPDQNFRGTSENAVITERFTRTGQDTILYSFTIDDPETFTAPWTGELPFTSVKENIYEYACHEGNYALPGILGAEREKEKTDAAAKNKGKE